MWRRPSRINSVFQGNEGTTAAMQCSQVSAHLDWALLAWAPLHWATHRQMKKVGFKHSVRSMMLYFALLFSSLCTYKEKQKSYLPSPSTSKSRPRSIVNPNRILGRIAIQPRSKSRDHMSAAQSPRKTEHSSNIQVSNHCLPSTLKPLQLLSHSGGSPKSDEREWWL